MEGINNKEISKMRELLENVIASAAVGLAYEVEGIKIEARQVSYEENGYHISIVEDKPAARSPLASRRKE